MWSGLLARARAGQPLWLPELRDAFSRCGTIPLIVRLRSFDGVTRTYRHTLPPWRDGEEAALALDYVSAAVYNALAVCGGWELTLYTDTKNDAMMALLAQLPARFQMDAPRRSGLGKVISIAHRMGRAFGKGEFTFAVSDIAGCAPEAEAPQPAAAPVGPRLRALCAAAEGANCVGVDIGGTDIKLAASRAGQLVAVKEYDWNPSAFTTAEELLGPVELLVRLMRLCIAAGDLSPLSSALRKDATDDEMAAAVTAGEQRWATNVLDAVGVSFPDIVLHDRIAGGETPKTDGMRRNESLDYETEFAKLSGLQDRLLALCRGRGRCHVINDGNMAAFTTAAELAAGGDDGTIGQGVVAHSLGTDLGTGWLAGQGAIPQLPLELYDAWVDLGSFPSAALPPRDLRSTRNENSGLPGARRYLGQAAAYRLAWALSPALLEGFTAEEDGLLTVAASPRDMRKPCLEHLMQRAGAGDAAAEEIFRQIGRHLAVVSRELGFLLHPAAEARFLYGRFVKSDRCFALLQQGFAEKLPSVRLVNGGDELANTALMRQLAARQDVTVAQFAQAVGALYYPFLQEDDHETK